MSKADCTIIISLSSSVVNHLEKGSLSCSVRKNLIVVPSNSITCSTEKKKKNLALLTFSCGHTCGRHILSLSIHFLSMHSTRSVSATPALKGSLLIISGQEELLQCLTPLHDRETPLCHFSQRPHETGVGRFWDSGFKVTLLGLAGHPSLVGAGGEHFRIGRVDFQIMMNATSNTSNSSCVIMTQPAGHLLMSIYIIAFILGLFFNLVTIGPIIQQICRKNIWGIYLVSLSISDLLYILTMPVWIYYFSNNHKWNLGQGLCSLVGFFYYSNMYISIFLLCCISIDRCLAITFPLRVQAFRRQRYAWIICGLVYILVMALHCLVLYLDKLTDPLNDSEQTCYETFPMTERIAMFNLIRVGIGFLLPLMIMSFCYWLIPTKVQQSRGVGNQCKRKVKLLSMGVIGIFSFCFAPYHILLMVRSIAYFYVGEKQSCNFEPAMYLPFTCSLALSSLNSVVDPVLYVLASNGVREDMRLFYSKIKQRELRRTPLVDSKWVREDKENQLGLKPTLGLVK
ncbi:G-protein coupled receptor 4-like [Carassius carassius]|uniref:G-protein coupled receptor 4-like n=1 Tax=Carassius carassius TaxID=217509 RepID=UPI002868A130|nr:G-protein coupled receptor 4-like [Carassius carassius]